MAKRKTIKELEEESEIADGVYRITLYGCKETTYMGERIDGKWYFADGTGWKVELKYQEEVVSFTPWESEVSG